MQNHKKPQSKSSQILLQHDCVSHKKKLYITALATLVFVSLHGIAHAGGNSNPPPSNCIQISSVPYTISKSNVSYCLAKSITFAGASGAPAITIEPGVKNDFINFNGNSLTLENNQEVGIQMLGTTSANVSNISIQNGTIQDGAAGTDSNNSAINLTDPSNSTNAAFNNISIKNMNFINANYGLHAYHPSDSAIGLNVNKSQFNNLTSGAITYNTIQNLAVVDSSFSSLPGGEVAIGGTSSQNVLVQNCTFNGIDGGLQLWNIGLPTPSKNITIANTTFNGGTFADINLIGWQNAKIVNDTFNDTNGTLSAIAFASDIYGDVQSSGLLIDNCTFNDPSTMIPNFAPYQAQRIVQIGSELGILFGSGLIVGANDVTITNSVFNQPNANQSNVNLAMDLLVYGVNGMVVKYNKFSSTATGRLPDCSLPLPYGIYTPGPDNGSIPDKAANIHFGSAWGQVNSTNVVIDSNIIEGPAQIGIYFQTSYSPTPNRNIIISNNSITATEQGILFDNTGSSLIVNNKISKVNGSACLANGAGVQFDGPLAYNATAASSNNQVVGNSISKNNIGVNILKGALNNKLLGNLFYGNKTDVVNGN